MTSEESCGNTNEDSACYHKVDTKFLKCERLNYEEERIKSFASWPVHFPVDPSRLAKAGFYYTGITDEVVCFSCQGHIKNWNYGDIVLKKHADTYPACDFIKNRSNNVPLLKTSFKSKTHTTAGNVGINNNCIQSNFIDYNKMKSESERLSTFSGKWPLSFINISDLAHAGFFYTGTGCKVQCPYCKGVISIWNVQSIPIQEHIKQFPWCDFLSENMPELNEDHSGLHSLSQDVCGNMAISSTLHSSKFKNDNSHHTNLEDLGVHLHKGPAHPHQVSLTERLKSFSNWPLSAPVSKEDLAAAGFFYTGVNDRTICFHCNGGLCSWEEGDNPWEEHARWFSTCGFLCLNKGKKFIESCTISSTVKDPNQSNRPMITGTILNKVDEAMKSNLVKYVLEAELFPLYIIRAALLHQIKQTGKNFANFDDLCIAASRLKEEMETQSFNVKPVETEKPAVCDNTQNCSILDVPSVSSNICTNLQKSQDSNSEKKDTSEKISSLNEDDSKDQCICKICMDKEVGVVFLPCGHLPACTVCAPALKICPMCRNSIQATVRVYLS